MNSYIHEVFNQIRQNQNVFLLNGPSVAELESKIHKLENRKVLYWGMNNIFANEEHILSKINKQFDFWIINHAISETQMDLVYDFLDRETSRILFVAADVLVSVRQYFCSRMPNNIHKIYILNTQPIHWQQNATLYSNEYYGTIVCLLYFYISINKKSPFATYIFGMDGLDINSNSNLTHAYNAISHNQPEYLFVDTQKLSLYNDMIRFDNIHTKNIMNMFGKNCFDNIINANSDSFYQSIAKLDQSQCVKEISQKAKDGFIDQIEPSFSIGEKCAMYNLLIQFVIESDHFMTILFESRKKFNTIEGKINTIEGKINTVEEKINTVEEKISAAEGGVYTIEEKINTVEEKINIVSIILNKSILRRFKNSINKRLNKLQNIFN